MGCNICYRPFVVIVLNYVQSCVMQGYCVVRVDWTSLEMLFYVFTFLFCFVCFIIMLFCLYYRPIAFRANVGDALPWSVYGGILLTI